MNNDIKACQCFRRRDLYYTFLTTINISNTQQFSDFLLWKDESWLHGKMAWGVQLLLLSLMQLKCKEAEQYISSVSDRKFLGFQHLLSAPFEFINPN